MKEFSLRDESRFCHIESSEEQRSLTNTQSNPNSNHGNQPLWGSLSVGTPGDKHWDGALGLSPEAGPSPEMQTYLPELEGLGQEKAGREGGRCDPRAPSPGMGSSRCPTGIAARGHLGTGTLWYPNRTEVKTRL